MFNKKLCEVQLEFSTMLRSVWGDFHVDYCDAFKNLNVLNGHQVDAFIQTLAPMAVHFLQSRFVSTPILESLIALLHLWLKITKLMSIVNVFRPEKRSKEEIKLKSDKCLKDLEELKSNLKEFKIESKNTIVASFPEDMHESEIVEFKGENFYFHVYILNNRYLVE